MKFKKENRRQRIHLRIKKKVRGTTERPRLAVYRSNKNIYCQLIDDMNGVTLASASTKDVSADGLNRVDQAKEVGKIMGSKAKSAKVEAVVFDRGGYLYHGRIQALAEGAREAGLKF